MGALLALALSSPLPGACLSAAASESVAPQGASVTPPGPEQTSRERTLVVLGDSLSAGYNLPGHQAFPAVLEVALRDRGLKIKVINAGVSGDTTTGGLERLDWSVPDNADGVIVELGANDMLRGIDPATPRKALTQIIERLEQRKIPVLLVGMRAAPNLGGRYADAFEGIYSDLARQYKLVLYPFFLDGVAGQPNLLLADGMHPNAEGVKVMTSNILPDVERFITTLQP